MRLVERDDLLDRVERLLAGCADSGRGRLVLVDGPTACGRTELLSATAQRARESGAIVLGAICSPAEQALPFGVLSQLLADAPLTGTPPSGSRACSPTRPRPPTRTGPRTDRSSPPSSAPSTSCAGCCSTSPPSARW